MTDRWTERLSPYLDGELTPEERSELELHLGTCAECATLLEDLRRIVALAPTYTGEPPATDHWPAIAEGIRALRDVSLADRLPRAPRRQYTLTQLVAASVAFAALVGGGVWYAMRPSLTPMPSVPVLAAAPDAGETLPVRRTPEMAEEAYDRAITDLERVLAEHRTRLDTATVRRLEASLATIDLAIAEARQAIARDPTANAFLQAQVANHMRRKLDVLRRATVVLTTSEL